MTNHSVARPDASEAAELPTGLSSRATVLDQVRAALTRYVVLPTAEAETAVVLWIAATHAVDQFEHATRLAIHSPVKRCGKSRLLEVVAGLAHSPMQTTNVSVAALFRMIDSAGDRPPTLILDEADQLFGSSKKNDENADLVAMLNNGFRRGSPTWRCVGPKQTPTEFATFAFAAIAGIGHLPDTIEDRAIGVTMRRRLPGEYVAKFRLRTDLPRLQELREKVAAWVSRAVEAHGPEVSVPDELEDRAADAWEPLLTIADAAGGDWPRIARQAAIRLSREASDDDADQSLDVRLLTDVRTVFESMPDARFVSTALLLDGLRKTDESPWSDFDFTSRRLALRLGKFGVKPGRNTANTERGYRRVDLLDAFLRYLPSEPSKASGVPSEQ